VVCLSVSAPFVVVYLVMGKPSTRPEIRRRRIRRQKLKMLRARMLQARTEAEKAKMTDKARKIVPWLPPEQVFAQAVKKA